VGSGRRDARKLVVYARQESLGSENLPLVVQVKEKDIRRELWEYRKRARGGFDSRGTPDSRPTRLCNNNQSAYSLYSASTWGEYGLHMAWKGRCV
jgi:hypothetical protein